MRPNIQRVDVQGLEGPFDESDEDQSLVGLEVFGLGYRLARRRFTSRASPGDRFDSADLQAKNKH